jgi:hypothetical protein
MYRTEPFTSPKCNASIETFYGIFEKYVGELLKDKHNNLSRDERMSLKDLESDLSIIHKKNDKGGGICLQNKCDYVNECC